MKIGSRLKVLKNVFIYTGAHKVLMYYILFIFFSAFIIMLTEPNFHSYLDALWYCYAVISTAGFGDIVVTAIVPKIMSVLLTIYSALALAILTGVVFNYFNQTIELRNEASLTAFIADLERLEELSVEELKEMSEKVKRFRAN